MHFHSRMTCSFQNSVQRQSLYGQRRSSHYIVSSRSDLSLFRHAGDPKIIELKEKRCTLLFQFSTCLCASTLWDSILRIGYKGWSLPDLTYTPHCANDATWDILILAALGN